MKRPFHLSLRAGLTLTMVASALAAPPAIRLRGIRSPAEGNPPINGQFQLVRDFTAAAAITVNITVAGLAPNPATEGLDFQNIPRQITFPANAVTVTIDTLTIDDTIPEGLERFTVSLAAGTGYTIGSPSFLNFNLKDNDPTTLRIVATDPNASETGPDGGLFTISRDGPNNVALTVYYSIPSHQRAADVDLTFFKAAPTIQRADADDVTARILSISIPSGSTGVTIPVMPVDDSLNEGPEPFTVKLKTLPGTTTYLIDPTAANATVMIADNDPGQPAPSVWDDLYDLLRMRRLDFTFTPANLAQLAGTFVPNMVSGQLSSDGETAMTIGIAHKSGGYKVDVNGFVSGQKWHDVQKFSLQEGPAGLGPVKEGLGWYIYRLAAGKTNTGLASWVTVYINGAYQGLYLHVEQPNEEFLDHRGLLGRNQSTWFYKENNELLLPNVPAYATPFPRATFYTAPRACSPAGSEGCDYADSADPDNFIPFLLVERLVNNIDGSCCPFNNHNQFRVDYYPLSSRKSLHFPWDQDDIRYRVSESTAPFLWPIVNPYYQQRQNELLRQWFQGPLQLAAIHQFLGYLQFMTEVPLALTPPRNPNFPNLVDEQNASQSTSSHFTEINSWFDARWAYVNAHLPPAPALAPQIQREGDLITLTPATVGADVWYTTDGSDPWTVANTLAPGATLYEHPFNLTRNTHLKARELYNSAWSTLAQATFSVAGHSFPLRISEIMYHPTNPAGPESDAGFTDDSEFEFLELQNHGAVPLDLSLCHFTGIVYTFPAGAQIPPRGFWVIVRNPKAFELRYPGRPYQGVYWDEKLDNHSETLTLTHPDGTILLSHTYNDSIGSTDGAGHSIVMPTFCAYGLPIRESPDVHGSAGDDRDVFPLRLTELGTIVINGQQRFGTRTEDYQLQPFVVEYSGDLNIWTTLVQAQGDEIYNDTFDPGAGAVAARFYRARFSPALPGDTRAQESQNAVGFFRKNLVPGFNLLSIPLIRANGNAISTVLSSLSVPATVYKFNYEYEYNDFTPGVGWSNPRMTLDPGESFWISVNNATELFCMGTVPEGALLTHLPSGQSLPGPMIPRPFPVSWLGLGPILADTSLYRWDGSLQSYYFDGTAWSPTEPILGLGEGVILNSPAASSWYLIFNRCD